LRDGKAVNTQNPAPVALTPHASRCPHAIFRDVLGAEGVARLLDYVTERHDDFTRGMAYNRVEREERIDPQRRDCLTLGDLGPLAGPFRARMREVATAALPALGIQEADVQPRELALVSYGDGGHFHAHIDTLESREHVRVLSCVYYFSEEPRRFGGGELRLYGFPSRDASEVARVDVEPDTDTLVAFPSWMRHEVLPVRSDSGAWRERRFTVNCWLHRAAAPVTS
jgi:SM-20-related protein